MTYSVLITGTAEEDLNGAADYIEYTLFSPQAAEALLDEAEKQISALAEFPEKHPLADDPVLSAWGIRFVAVKDYLAFYTVFEPEKTVFVVRFLHSRRNWASILKRTL